ncbi:hypothetical protein AQF52_0183 [Streptomyces venezuelae]|nr:hypothetical protein AQF52_0183 [Streptomyces venezuelae]
MGAATPPGAGLQHIAAVYAGGAAMLAIAKAEGPEDALPAIYSAVIVAGVFGSLLAPWFSKLIPLLCPGRQPYG